MDLNLINPYTLRILISCREEDSISAISKRINLSYGWTYKWVQSLAEAGVFTLTRMKVYLNKNNSFHKKTLQYIKNIFKNTQFYYEALSLFGISYSFTNIDSVYIWTKGGYNIARFKDYYPIFVKIKSKDKFLFEKYCRKLSLNINKKSGVFYKPEYLDDFDHDYCEGMPVDSLKQTIGFMKKNKFNFEPALEMIAEVYGQKLKVKYKETNTNV